MKLKILTVLTGVLLVINLAFFVCNPSKNMSNGIVSGMLLANLLILFGVL